MNKKPKKIFRKDEEKEKSNKIVKDKFKIKLEKNWELTQTKTQISPTKSKINSETKKYNRKLKVHNSICSKEEVKKKLSNIQIRNRNSNVNLISSNTNNKSDKLFLSNYLFLTNDTNSRPKEKDKKIKKNKNIKSHNNGEKINLPQLNSAFKKNMFKKTIIIDYEGNNNLNLNLPKGEKDYKKILRKNNNNDSDNNLTSSFNRNTEENSLFENSSKLYLANLYFNNNDIKGKEEDIKQTLIDKNEEERRLKEYNRIFNLLNTNIEQFKKMFNCNNNNSKNVNNNHINKNYNKNDYNENKKIIIADRKYIGGLNSLNKYKTNDKEKAKKIKTSLKTNLSEKILSSRNKNTRNNLNIFPIDINDEYTGDNNIEIYNNNNCSFLESSIQDEFYKSLINQSFLQNISHSSFGINSNDISSESNKIGNKKNNDKISLTESNNLVGNNIMRLDINDIYKDENIKNKFRTPILKEKNNKDNMDKGNTEFKNDNNCKTYSNDIDKNNCLII
jgi:hypothetical protein